MKLVNIREESYAKHSETDYIQKDLKRYCLKNEMAEFKHSMRDVASKHDFDFLTYEINNLKKSNIEFMVKHEFNTRLRDLSQVTKN